MLWPRGVIDEKGIVLAARRKKDDENDTIIIHETTTGITLIGQSCRVVEIYHVFRAGHYCWCTSLLAVDDGVRAFDVRSTVVNGGLPQKKDPKTANVCFAEFNRR